MGPRAGAVAAIIVLFIASAVFALAETAFVKANRIKLRALADQGEKRAARIVPLLDNQERTLNSVLLLLLGCQMVSATLLGSVLEPTFGTAGLFIGSLLEITVFFTFAEVAPKTYAVQHPEDAVMRMSGLLSFVTHFAPLRVITHGFIGLANIVLPGRGLAKGPFVTENEILTMADVAADEDEIETEERELIHSIFEFGDTLVREVMLPRPDMIAVEVDATVDEAVNTMISAGYSRVPAYDDTVDNVLGLIYLKDLVGLQTAQQGSEPVRGAVREAVYVPESKRVAELLREMQQQKFHMAIVVDEYGGTAGLVTLEDLLEEIVGEITDEYDVEEPRVEHLSEGNLRCPGRTPIDEINEELDAHLPDVEWDTVGGLVFNTLGHVPVEGECVTVDGIEFCAERVQGRRIVSVLVSRLPVPAAAADDDDVPESIRRS